MPPGPALALRPRGHMLQAPGWPRRYPVSNAKDVTCAPSFPANALQAISLPATHPGFRAGCLR